MTESESQQQELSEGPFGVLPPEPASARAIVDEMIDAGLLDRLMSSVGEGGLSLTGEGGSLPEFVKSVLERGLQAELTEHVGYEKGDPAGRGSSNSRNGFTPKTVHTEIGDVELATPRDRLGSSEPRLVRRANVALAASPT